MTWPFENDTSGIVSAYQTAVYRQIEKEISLLFCDCTCQRIAICYCPLWLWSYAGNAEPQPKNSADYVSCDF